MLPTNDLKFEKSKLRMLIMTQD